MNKYGQRLDEYNEFGQSLEAEAWYFADAAALPYPPTATIPFTQLNLAGNRTSGKLVGVRLNKYGQRLDEFNEFGQSLEAETWYFADAVAPETAGDGTSPAELHRRAA